MWRFQIDYNEHNCFTLDGHYGISILKFWPLGVAWNYNKRGIILLNFLIGWTWWDEDDWHLLNN